MIRETTSFSPARSVVEVRQVDAAGSPPELLLRLGEADLGLLYGASVSGVRAAPGLRVQRLPGWDRRLFLWMHPRGRWVNDPQFRRWLAHVIDREALAELLFEGEADVVHALTPVPVDAPLIRAVDRRPFTPPTLPRLRVVFDSADDAVARVVRRVQAQLELEGVRVEPVPRGAAEIASGMARPAREDQITLLTYRPATLDPVAGLDGLFRGFDDSAAPTLRLLEWADSLESRQDRLDGAFRAERGLLESGLLMPLVRVRAWIGFHKALQISPDGPFGRLGLWEMEWER